MNKIFKKALLLEYFTVGYSILEALASIYFGSMAMSIALVSFGLDGVIDSISGLILVWRLRKHERVSKGEENRIERRAIKYVALTFIILGIYIFIESVQKLIFVEIPELPGIAIAVLSVIIMSALSLMKRDAGEKLSCKALIADSEQTSACALLSVSLLIGLMANYFLGIWQADLIVGLIIAIFLFRKGLEWLKEARVGGTVFP